LKTPVDWPKGEVELNERPKMSCACATENARAETMKVDESLNMMVNERKSKLNDGVYGKDCWSSTIHGGF